jgi:hypothetical protein
VVGTQRFALDMTFSVAKTLDREPNTAEINVFNLSETSRRAVEEETDQQVILSAGYDQPDGVSDIFTGQLRKGSSVKRGPDIITTIEAADGEKRLREARINTSFAPGASLKTAVEAAANSLRVGIGNLAESSASLDFEGLGRQFVEGVVLSGPTREELTGLLDSAGYEWTIQDGNLQLLQRGKGLIGTAIVLSPSTGLIDSPSIDSEGVLTARTLMIPNLFPGRRVQVESRFATGIYRITKSQYTGDTRGNEWYIDIEGKISE